jgi:hypothetical protein
MASIVAGNNYRPDLLCRQERNQLTLQLVTLDSARKGGIITHIRRKRL